MRLYLALMLVALVLVPAPVMLAKLGRPPGAYPAQVRTLVQDVLDDAEATAWPAGAPLQPRAAAALDGARAALDEGRVATAIDTYVQVLVVNAVDHLAERLEGVGPGPGREELANVTTGFTREGRAAVVAGRAVVNAVDEDALSLRGAEAGLWGAYLVARGEFQLNLLAQVGTRDLYRNGSVDKVSLHTALALTMGSSALVNLGAAIASVAPAIAGGTLDDGEMAHRLDQIATRQLVVSGRPPYLSALPRGDATTDGALLRAGLLLVSANVLKNEEMRRIYVQAADRQNVTATVNEVLSADRGELAPWAALGSALALAAYEQVDRPDYARVSRAELERVLEYRSFARTVIDAEAVLDPDPPPIETPGPAVLLVFVAVAASAVLSRRR